MHFAANESPMLRIDGELVCREDATADAREIEAFLAAHFDDAAHKSLQRRGCCDVVLRSKGEGAVRLHAFCSANGIRCAARLLPISPPSLESLDLPRVIFGLASRRNGLVLVVGPSGSGKTTLLAAMVEHLNRTAARNVIVLEDPIEYVHTSGLCTITQCEIGRDAPDFSTAIHGVLRADPDVIVIGELRDANSLRTALLAAETGHLVLASLHTRDACQAVERIVDSFPTEGREQIRVQMAQTMCGIVAIRLVRRAKVSGRRAIAEILLANDAVRNLLREGKAHLLRSAMQTGRNSGMQTFEMHLMELLRREDITLQEALTVSEHLDELSPATGSAP